MSIFLNKTEVDNYLREMLGDFVSEENIFQSRDYMRACELLSHLPADVVRRVIKGSIIYSELSMENVTQVTLSNIISVIKSSNHNALLQYQAAVEAVDAMGISEHARGSLLKQVYSSIGPYVDGADKSMVDVAGEFVQKTQKVTSTFSSLTGTLRADMVAKIYSNCIGRMKAFWQRVEIDRFKSVIETLTSELGDENFTEDELIDLSTRCATIFCESSREKILGIESVLKDYKNCVLENLKNQPEMDSELMKQFKQLKFGHIIRRAGSIAKSAPDQVAAVSLLLQGKTIGEIFSEQIEVDNKNKDKYKQFKDAKIDLSVKDMVWVMTKNPSLFGSSVDMAISSLDLVKKSMIASYGERAKGINYSELLTRDNFLKGMPKLQNSENVKKTIELLSSFVPANELAEFLKQDMRVLEVDYDNLHSLVLNAFIGCKDTDDIVKTLNKTLKSEIKNLANKKEKKESSSVSKPVEQSKDSDFPKINVSFDTEEIRDLFFDFDIKKLKTILGPHFEEFAQKFKTSSIDTGAIRGVINKSKEQNIDAELVLEKKTGSIVIDANKVQGFVHKKQILDVDVIEMLWQLYRNTEAASALVQKFVRNPEKYKDRDKIFITSTNYFKVATERDEILAAARTVPDSLVEAADFVKSQIEESFVKLTREYAQFVKQDKPYLEAYIGGLEDQKVLFEKRISENEFANLIGDNQTIDEIKIDLEKRLSESRVDFDKIEKEQAKLKEQKKKKESELRAEKENPTSQIFGYIEKDGVAYNVLGLLGMSEVEARLEKELNQIIKKSETNTFKLEFIANQIRSLENSLSQLNEALQSEQIYKNIQLRLASLKSRLEHAYRIKNIIEDDELK